MDNNSASRVKKELEDAYDIPFDVVLQHDISGCCIFCIVSKRNAVQTITITEKKWLRSYDEEKS